MREYKIKVFPSKKLVCLNGLLTLGMNGENRATRLEFIIDESLIGEYNYVTFTSPSGNSYICELGDDLCFVVKNWITSEIGTWKLEFVSTTQANIQSVEDIDENQTIIISEQLAGYVVQSATGEGVEIEPNEDAKILITQIEQELDNIEEVLEQIASSGLEIDFTTVLNAITAAKVSIENKIDEIDVDLTPVLTKLTTLEGKVDNIPTTDYSSDFGVLESAVGAIPTNDYTQTLSGIVLSLGSISDKIDNIDVDLTPITGQLDTIEGKVDLIPTNDYTTKLNGIENKIDAIPTTDNTSNISSIKNTVEAIPTTDYTSKLNTIDGKIDNIPTNDYTNTLATMQTSINGQGGLSSQIGQQTSLINSISQDTTATNNRTATMATDIASIKTTTESDYALEQQINAKVGDNDTKADGTLFNYAYWSLQRANEAKANAGDAKDNTITILSDLATMQDDITYIKNNIGGGGHESWTFPSFDYMFATDGNDQTGGRITIASELLSHSPVPGKISGSANYLFYQNRYLTAAQINAIDLSGATHLISAFSQIANPQNLSVSDVLTLDLSSCVSMAQCFEGFGGVSAAVGGVGKIVFENSGNVDNWGSCFYNFQPYTPGSQWGSWALNLTDIEIDLSGANNVYNMFTNGVPNLVNLTINGSFGGDSTEPNLDALDLSTTSVTYASITAMLTGIEANNSGYTRTFNLPSSITIDQTLTDLAASKNYTLTQS